MILAPLFLSTVAAATAPESPAPLPLDSELRLMPSLLSAPASAPATAPASAPSEDGTFNYDYVQAGLQLFDLRGLRLDASKTLSEGEPWILTAHSDVLEVEQSVNLRSLSAGGGYVYEATEELDIVGTAEVEYGYVTALRGFSDTEFGIRIRGGARYLVQEDIEVFGGIVYRSIFDIDPQVELGGRWEFADGMSLVTMLEFGEWTSVGVGFRQSL